MKLLIVDDEASICFAMSDYFITLGYKVDCAQKVEEAQSLLSSGSYSVIISDLQLTGNRDMGGLEVIRFAQQHYPATKNIVLTAYGSAEVEAEVRGYGVEAFLHKPRPLAEIAQVVEGLIGNRS